MALGNSSSPECRASILECGALAPLFPPKAPKFRPRLLTAIGVEPSPRKRRKTGALHNLSAIPAGPDVALAYLAYAQPRCPVDVIA